MNIFNYINPFNLFKFTQDDFKQANVDWKGSMEYYKNLEKPTYFNNAQRQQLQSYLATLIRETEEELKYSLDLAKTFNASAKIVASAEAKEAYKATALSQYKYSDKINKKIKNLAKLQSVVKNLYTEE